jgi:hypothetical protein
MLDLLSDSDTDLDKGYDTGSETEVGRKLRHPSREQEAEQTETDPVSENK